MAQKLKPKSRKILFLSIALVVVLGIAAVFLIQDLSPSGRVVSSIPLGFGTADDLRSCECIPA